MTEDYKLIDELHEELESVHEGLKQYDGVQLENGYETGLFMSGNDQVKGYENVLQDKDSFDENGCLLRAASSLEEMGAMIQHVSGAEYVTLGRIPIEGPIGESLVDNVNLNYNVSMEDGSPQSYWELDSELVDTGNNENAEEQVRGIESIVDNYTSTQVERMDVESESQALKGITARSD